MWDLVIEGGTLVDGTGAPPRRADVAVDGDTIVEVGDDLGSARRRIDADGAIVTPGFVDMHTHYDGQATWDPDLTPSGWHGVTTVVMGNCGVGFAPVAPDRRDWLIELMEGVEDIPGAALADGISWEWESFPEYLDALDARSWVADVGTQVPHGALRAYVMGEAGAADEPATAAHRAEMARLVGEALEAGALGFSTSRTPLHKAKDGRFVPGTDAAIDELVDIAGAVAGVGHGVIQMALHHPDVMDQIPWLRQLAEITGRPVTFNLQQPDEAPELWRDVAAELDRAAADGVELWAQVAGRPIGILMCWDGSAHPFMLHRAYQPLAGLDRAARLERLRDPAVRAEICAEVVDPVTPFIDALIGGFDKMWPFDGETDYEPSPSDSVAGRAARNGRTPAEVAYDQMLSEDGRGLIYFPLFNYADRDLEALRELHHHPRTRMGLADAGAHCGAICDGAMPSFMLSFWCRDRTRGPQMDLAHVIRRQTADTAAHYGLHDRGVVAPGMRADLNVIDFDGLSVERPHMVDDLPTGARRFIQRADGYRATICRGVVVTAEDQLTGERPGRLIRGPQPAS